MNAISKPTLPSFDLSELADAQANLYIQHELSHLEDPEVVANAREDVSAGYLIGVREAQEKIGLIKDFVDELVETSAAYGEPHSHQIATTLYELVKRF